MRNTRRLVRDACVAVGIISGVFGAPALAGSCFDIQERLAFCGKHVGYAPMRIPGAGDNATGFEHNDGGGLVFMVLPWTDDLGTLADRLMDAAAYQAEQIGHEATFLERRAAEVIGRQGVQLSFITHDGREPFVYLTSLIRDGADVMMISTYRVSTEFDDSDRERHDAVLVVTGEAG